ncbi:MAG: hypothetical protein Q4A18_02475 [Rikenellaceae bacterium]|nr:hypothetical protein [Rikenellaceae bacterium]
MTAMRFEGDFYTVDHFEQHDDGFLADVVLNADHAIYAGHFPAQPVVPGVCTMTLIRELCARALDRNCFFRTVRECKFVAALIPEAGLKIRIEASIEGAKLRATVKREEQIILKLQAQIE